MAAPYIGPVAAASILAGIAIAIGLVLLIIPGLALIAIWCLIVPVILLEQTGVLGSFRRSFQLVRGYFWIVFGTLVLVWLILIGVSIVLGVIFSFMPAWLGSFLSNLISGTLVAPFVAVVVTLMYFPAGGGPRGRRGECRQSVRKSEPVRPRRAGYLRRSATGPQEGGGYPPTS